MLNIRTVILSVVLVILLLLAVPLVTARTEGVSAPAADSERTVVDSATRSYIAWAEAADSASALDNQEQSASQSMAAIPSYRSPLDECFDVPLSEAAACHAESQIPVPSFKSSLDECFEVSISELVSCRNASQALAP